jgi:hypothetical protein
MRWPFALAENSHVLDVAAFDMSAGSERSWYKKLRLGKGLYLKARFSMLRIACTDFSSGRTGTDETAEIIHGAAFTLLALAAATTHCLIKSLSLTGLDVKLISREFSFTHAICEDGRTVREATGAARTM